MSKYRLIIFDLDDTLLDYSATERRAVAGACDAFSVTAACDLYLEYKAANRVVRREYGDIVPGNIDRFRVDRALEFLRRLNRADVDPEGFVEAYLRYSTVGVLLPGVKETIEQLRAVSKVVATNGSIYPRRNRLENSGISHEFRAFFSSESLGVSKPDTTYFRRIITQCAVPDKEVLVVGDNYRLDIASAVTTGLHACWFNHRREPLAEDIPGAVTIIEQFAALVPVVGEVTK